MGMIRFSLALLVALSHAGSWLSAHDLSPRLAVTGFYVISGFYIQFIIAEKYSRGANWIRRFYGSRILRLFPLYYLVVAATVVLCLVTGKNFTKAVAMADPIFSKGALELQIGYVFSNLLILGQDVFRLSVLMPPDGHIRAFVDTVFIPRAIRGMDTTILGQSWSLALELWFYLLAPWLLRARTGVLVGLVLASAALRAGLMLNGYGLDWDRSGEWVNAFFPSELGMFLLGSLACRRYLSQRQGLEARPGANLLGHGLAVLVVAYLYGYGFTLAGFYPWSYFAFPIAMAACLPWIFHASRSLRWDGVIGEVSYPLYMVHFLFVFTLGSTQSAGVVVTAAVAAAFALLFALDRPLSRLRHRWFLGER